MSENFVVIMKRYLSVALITTLGGKYFSIFAYDFFFMFVLLRLKMTGKVIAILSSNCISSN